MYGKITRARADCTYGNLAYIQKMTAALGMLILWWWSQDKSKCLLSFYKALITYTLKTAFNVFKVSLNQQDHITERYPCHRAQFTTTKLLTKPKISLCLLPHESALT